MTSLSVAFTWVMNVPTVVVSGIVSRIKSLFVNSGGKRLRRTLIVTTAEALRDGDPPSTAKTLACWKQEYLGINVMYLQLFGNICFADPVSNLLSIISTSIEKTNVQSCWQNYKSRRKLLTIYLVEVSVRRSALALREIKPVVSPISKKVGALSSPIKAKRTALNGFWKKNSHFTFTFYYKSLHLR